MESQKNMPEERCMKIFLASIKTEATKIDYTNRMIYFKNFAKFEKYSDLLSMDVKKLSELIEDYILHRRETNNPNSIGCYYFPIQAFLEMNDILLNFKKLKRLFPAKIKTVVERGWTTEEIEKMLHVCSNEKQRAIIYFENASGGRLGIFNGLKIKHLIEINDPDVGKCYGIIGYADELEEYITFLTPEATKALDEYFDKRKADHEIFNDDSPVFRAQYSIGSAIVKPATSKSLGSIPQYIQKNAGLRDPTTKKWNRYPVPTNHGFRHRFDEVIKSVVGINTHIAEKMFAHTSRLVPLDGTYHTPKIENSFKEYKKIIHLLTIDQTEVQKIKIQEQDNVIRESQDLKERVKKLELEILERDLHPIT